MVCINRNPPTAFDILQEELDDARYHLKRAQRLYYSASLWFTIAAFGWLIGFRVSSCAFTVAGSAALLLAQRHRRRVDEYFKRQEHPLRIYRGEP